MVEVYITDTRHMKEDISLYRDALLPERWERANRFVFLKDRLLCVAAGMLLREVLGVERSEELTKNEYGKPALAAGGVEFNLSHSGRFCVLAVGDTPLGVDIEKISVADGSVAEKCYTKTEIAYLYGKSGGQEERFALLWTRKESADEGDRNGVLSAARTVLRCAHQRRPFSYE